MLQKYYSLLICFLLTLFGLNAASQNAPLDTSFSTSFAFATKSGIPTGSFLFKDTGIKPFVVFEYSDGRKYTGLMAYNRPVATCNSVVYYPDGTTYIGAIKDGMDNYKTDQENTGETMEAFACIHYPDGGIFIGNAGQYRLRSGFQFAPDGSYMLGSFWYRLPFGYLTYKTVHYSKEHQRESEGYHIRTEKEMDLETFIDAYKSQKPNIFDFYYSKLKWKRDHSKNKTDEIEKMGYQKDKSPFGFFRDVYSSKGDNKLTVWEGSVDENQYYEINYKEPGDTAYIKIPAIYRSYVCASRIRYSNTMQFRQTYSDQTHNDDVPNVVYNVNFDGSSYLGGSWYFGMLDGYGIYATKDNGTYYGRFLYSKRNGFGTFKYADGSYFKGTWKDDIIDGPGKLFNAAGILTSEGIYKDGKLITPQKNIKLGYYEFIDEFPIVKNTSQLLITQNVVNKKLGNAIYTGSINGESPEGQGTMIMEGGDSYAGKWHNGLPDGVFTVTYSSLRIMGKNIVSIIYKGGLKDFLFEGLGILIKDSVTTSGNWHLGILNGIGTFRGADGMGETGNFVNGKKEGRFDITNKNNYPLGYFTYLHGIEEGLCYYMYPAKNKDVEGSYHNGLPDGRFTVYNRNPYYSNGIMLTAPTRAGYITYKNGVKVSMENDAETPLLKDESLSQPVCTYCNGAGIIGSGKYFMGREIPNRCPRCGGTGYTWLNPK